MQSGQMRGERSRGWSFSCRPGPDALKCSCASFALVLSLSCRAALSVAFPVGGKTHEQTRKRGVHARCCRLIYFPLVRLSSPPALQDSGGWKRQHSQQNSPLEPRPLKIPDRSPQSRALGARTRTRSRKSLRGKQTWEGRRAAGLQTDVLARLMLRGFTARKETTNAAAAVPFIRSVSYSD